ncbi:hypothetical protein B046DRAFT_01626 [Streptomyces sp. LamerLS-316]|uniref:hypothetical protein n=1 Tax=unclassified Streptomyces TaxID=2593676 RepID=UPI000823B59D|nr:MULTISPECIES: hypothetical protein [unclassified Streptomyces]MYQ40583.1 hypothetical protein [Streptomyces sp. SID4921]SCK16438.1 hypothetical protein B046DRAFT_01626 [Streptomyces sp. LamerLS-316]
MHSDIHLLLHTYRSAELRHDAAEFVPVRPGLRHRMGWTLVELGLRLAQSRPQTQPARAARTA